MTTTANKSASVTSYVLAGRVGADAALVTVTARIDEDARPARSGPLAISAWSEHRVKETSVRVRSALEAAGVAFPRGVVTIEIDARDGLMPANYSAVGLDLPIAMAIIGAAHPSHEIAQQGDIYESGLVIAGELGLDGSIHPVRGVLAAALEAPSGLLVPESNAAEAVAGAGVRPVFAARHLADVERLPLLRVALDLSPRRRRRDNAPDFADVRGQATTVDAIERAVTEHLKYQGTAADGGVGRMVLVGPPGAGKTMIARRVPTIMPVMTRGERVSVTRYYSAVGLAGEAGLIGERPFRAPHHTISTGALVGGGTPRRPGEVQLAARGVLFLDEIEEFRVESLRALAEELRAMPAAERPLIVAAANPCPCGWYALEGEQLTRTCTCTTNQRERHAARVSVAANTLGITWRVSVPSVSFADFRASAAPGEASEVIRGRVEAALASSPPAPPAPIAWDFIRDESTIRLEHAGGSSVLEMDPDAGRFVVVSGPQVSDDDAETLEDDVFRFHSARDSRRGARFRRRAGGAS